MTAAGGTQNEPPAHVDPLAAAEGGDVGSADSCASPLQLESPVDGGQDDDGQDDSFHSLASSRPTGAGASSSGSPATAPAAVLPEQRAEQRPAEGAEQRPAPEPVGSRPRFRLSPQFRSGACRGAWDYKPYVSAQQWDLDDAMAAALSAGQAPFGFRCAVGTKLSEQEIRMLGSAINLTVFRDEMEQNYAPYIDMGCPRELSGNTFLIVRTMYILPDVSMDVFSVELLSSVEYHKECQPSSRLKPLRVWEDCKARGDNTTFRITKFITPQALGIGKSVTIQFRVSEVDAADLPRLCALSGGVRVERALLMERTKRTPGQDTTRKVKSLLMFHSIDGGVLVMNTTLIANSMIPDSLAGIINRAGSWGSSEAADTANRTNAFLRRRLRELMASRSPPQQQDRPAGCDKLAVPRRRIRQPGSDDPSRYTTRSGGSSTPQTPVGAGLTPPPPDGSR
eukprot:TRINITY_DN47324_c0_g1_i1.p1 TRINITY_DN47324_c0_g1~~TRINITY_DN47324_c0_g1_i1.p1  ORF type:complete len:452 (+),score=89.68 TRINITY_DN47324_c0_g1_i1:123-1478(+)